MDLIKLAKDGSLDSKLKSERASRNARSAGEWTNSVSEISRDLPGDLVGLTAAISGAQLAPRAINALRAKRGKAPINATQDGVVSMLGMGAGWAGGNALGKKVYDKTIGKPIDHAFHRSGLKIGDKRRKTSLSKDDIARFNDTYGRGVGTGFATKEDVLGHIPKTASFNAYDELTKLASEVNDYQAAGGEANKDMKRKLIVPKTIGTLGGAGVGAYALGKGALNAANHPGVARSLPKSYRKGYAASMMTLGGLVGAAAGHKIGKGAGAHFRGPGVYKKHMGDKAVRSKEDIRKDINTFGPGVVGAAVEVDRRRGR